MKIVVYDENQDSLDEISHLIKDNVRSDDVVSAFVHEDELIEYTQEYLTDGAFLSLYEDGKALHLVDKLHEVNAKMNIVFVSESEQYLTEAFQLHISGFVKAPATGEDIRREMQNLRFHVEEFRKASLDEKK